MRGWASTVEYFGATKKEHAPKKPSTVEPAAEEVTAAGEGLVPTVNGDDLSFICSRHNRGGTILPVETA